MPAWMVEPIGSGRDVNGFSGRLESVKEKSAQTFKNGAVLIATAGIHEEAAANPAAATVVAISRRAGRNLAANDTSEKLQVFTVERGKRFRGCLKEAQSTVEVGTQVGLEKDATTGYWVFSTAVVNKVFKVRKKNPFAAAADTYAPIEVEMI
jgi:hypothetical protein